MEIICNCIGTGHRDGGPCQWCGGWGYTEEDEDDGYDDEGADAIVYEE